MPSNGFLGVNLGGFLVLESWITPSLFANYSVADGLGEWQFCAQLGPALAAQVMNQHWDTWVTEVGTCHASHALTAHRATSRRLLRVASHTCASQSGTGLLTSSQESRGLPGAGRTWSAC